MRRLLREHPDIAVKLVISLGRRLREANERIARQSFQTVQSRVAGVLGQLVVQAQAEGAGERDVLVTDHPGRHRAARRLLARVGQPLPRGARARRRRHPGPRPRDRPRPGGAAALRLLSAWPASTEFSAGGVVVNDAHEVVVIVPTRRAADGSQVLALPKGHPDGERVARRRRRCARCARRPASRRSSSSSLGEVRYWYQRGGRRIAKVVEFFLLRYVSGDVADHDHEVEHARWMPATRGASRRSPTRASATWCARALSQVQRAE